MGGNEMSNSERPVLSLLPSTEPEVTVHLPGTPAEFTRVSNPFVTLHLGKSSMGIRLHNPKGDSEWMTISFIRYADTDTIGIVSTHCSDPVFITPKENNNAVRA
jgi:hypothetical protein